MDNYPIQAMSLELVGDLAPFSIAAIREIAESHNYKTLYWRTMDDGVMVDAITANMFIKVFDALRKDTQVKVQIICARGSVQFVNTVDKFWKCCK